MKKYYYNSRRDGQEVSRIEYDTLEELLTDVRDNGGLKQLMKSGNSVFLTKVENGVTYVRHYYSDEKRYVWDVMEETK